MAVVLPGCRGGVVWWSRRRERERGSRRRGRSRDEDVAGLVDGGGDVGPIDRAGGADGDRAGGQVDVDRLDPVDGRDLLRDRAAAVLAGHSGDGERRRTDEGAGGGGQHRLLLAVWGGIGQEKGSLPSEVALTGEIARGSPSARSVAFAAGSLKVRHGGEGDTLRLRPWWRRRGRPRGRSCC